MYVKLRVRIPAALAAAVAALALFAPTAQAQTLPSMKILTAPLISPTAAETFYGSATTHTNSLSGVTGFGATPPEIVETARALKNNPDLIYEYVHNQVEAEFAFGLRKGALGALVNRSGTPFDQNALFIALVRQAGYSARYQIGRVTISGTAFAAWTGVSDIQAACRMLSSGGIPAAFNGASSSPSDCSVSGTFTSVTILHVWSQVQIAGTWYAYDPSFKSYTVSPGRNLITGSGIVAGAASTAAASTIDSGTQSGSNYIHNASASGLNTYLQARGVQLLGDLTTNVPTQDTAAVVGLTKIIPAYSPVGGWRNTSPPGYTSTADITLTGDIPDQYRAKLRVTVSAKLDGATSTNLLDWPFYVDDIDARRVGVSSNFLRGQFTNGFSSAGWAMPPQTYNLLVDDVVVQSYSCTPPNGPPPVGLPCAQGQSGTVTLAATHPYAANSGTYGAQTVTKFLATLSTPFAIVSGWGSISPALMAKWSTEAVSDASLPIKNSPPGNCGAGDPPCWNSPDASAGDFTRQKTAAGWLAQVSLMLRIHAQLGNATADHQHSIGVVDWRAQPMSYAYPVLGYPSSMTYYGVTDQYTELNVDTSVSITSRADDLAKTDAIARSVALSSATLEGSILEQTENMPDTGSTASRFAWGNHPDNEDPCFTSNNPRRIYDFTGSTSTNRASIYQYEGSASGCSAAPSTPMASPSAWATFLESGVSGYLGAGFNVTALGETFLGPGARFGSPVVQYICSPTCPPTVAIYSTYNPSQQRGGALIATRYDSVSGHVVEIAHTLTGLNGITKGGGGKDPSSFSAYDPTKAADLLKDRFVDRSVALGVDLKTGTVGYTTPTLLSVGTGQAPYKLDFSLSFKAAPTACLTQFGPCTGPVQGGWTHNWDIRFSTSGSGLESMGATSPFEAAGTLTAFLVMQDIFSDTTRSNLEKDSYAALTADWWRQQMVANTATVTRGLSGQQYIRLVDGTWMAPIGSPGTLVQTGTQAKYRDTCQQIPTAGYAGAVARRWDFSGVSFALTNAGGDTMNFANWSWNWDSPDNTCAFLYGYKPTTWTFPQGPSITFTYDYQLGVTGVTTSLGRSMTFSGTNTGLSPITATSGGITVGQLTNMAGQIIGIGDAAGAAWEFDYTTTQARSATQRPVPYLQLAHVFEPVSATLPALQYNYDSRGIVKTALDANGLQLPANAGLPPYQFLIALNGRGERDDPNGGAYAVYYDTDGNEVRNIDEIGREVDSLWDGRHRVTNRTFPLGDQEQFTHDLKDNVTGLTKVAVPGSGLANISISATYDPTWNKLASITDALSNTTTFAYYGAGVSGASMMQTATRPAVGGVHPVYSFQYNAIGLMTQSVDPVGVTTTHAYDSYGNLTSTTAGAAAVGTNPALNLTTTFTPDGVGNITRTTDPLSHHSDQTFDADHRVLLSISPDPGSGVRTAKLSTYDGNGRVIQVDQGTTNSSGGGFTALETSITQFDASGNAVLAAKLNGASGSARLTLTQTSYDALNRPICTAQRENTAIFAAPPASACAQSTGGANGPDHISQLTYDLAGQKLVETRGLGTAIQHAYATYTYDANGNLATILDANANLTTNLYDGFDRLAKTEYPSPTLGSGTSNPSDAEAYTYDANSNRTSLTKRDGTTVIGFTYDPLNRQATKTFAATPAANVAYGYDLAGRRLNALYANVTGTPGVAWTYDAAGREITEATNGRTLTFAYDNASNPASLTWPDSQTITYTFDGANQFTHVGNTAVGIGFSYDSLGRMAGINRVATTSTLTYDNADRLTGLTHSLTTNPVTYTVGFTPVSQINSRASSTATYDWAGASAASVATVADGLNRNATVGGTAWTYNANGNLTNDGTRTFTYDAENRLLSDTVGGSTVLALAYDPLGRLQQTTAGATVVNYLYHANELVAEYDGSGNVLRRYVHGPGEDNPAIWFEGSGVAATNASYLIADRQGSIIATTNTGGTTTATLSYDAYGIPASWSAVPGFGYTGQLAMPQAQLWHYKARAYDPVSGKFMQTDSVGYRADLNLYAYVSEDPTDRADPTGQISPCITDCHPVPTVAHPSAEQQRDTKILVKTAIIASVAVPLVGEVVAAGRLALAADAVATAARGAAAVEGETAAATGATVSEEAAAPAARATVKGGPEPARPTGAHTQDAPNYPKNYGAPSVARPGAAPNPVGTTAPPQAGSIVKLIVEYSKLFLGHGPQL